MTDPDLPLKDEPETIRQMLKVFIPTDQKNELASHLARNISLLTDLKEELDTVKAQYKGRITAVEGEISGIARQINIGYTMENIECRVVRDFDKKTVTLFRMDMDPEEFISERPMTRDELQRKLNFDAAQAAGEPCEACAPSQDQIGVTDEGKCEVCGRQVIGIAPPETEGEAHE